MRSWLSFLAVSVAAWTVATGAIAQIADLPAGWRLERVVLLSRHGVRSPIHTQEELRDYAESPWPIWPVRPGALTPHGARLMRLMGGFYRSQYGGLGLLDTDGCPSAGAVAAWSDVDERTRLTALELLAGLYPGCGLRERHLPNMNARDPLFRHSRSPSCPIEPASERAAILARVGGSFAPVLREYAPQFGRVQAVLCPDRRTPAKSACGIGWPIRGLDDRNEPGFALWEPIPRAGRVVEFFLMESADGRPPDQVAWGRLGPDQRAVEAALRDLLVLRRLEFDLVNRTPLLARQHGSALLARIVDALADGERFPGRPPGGKPLKLGLLVGHDSNVANLGGLLALHWEIPGFPVDEPSPGGALAFELMRETATGRRFVRLVFYAQTIDQMHRAVPLDRARPPGRSAVAFAACRPDEEHGACPFERFVAIARSVIDPGCSSD